MKIAVSSCGIFLDSPIDPRFGRCDYFVIVDTDDMSFEVFENESTGLAQGAGVQSAEFLISKGAEVVITENVGPNALSALSEGGVEVVISATGSVKEAVENYRHGRLTSVNGATVRGCYGRVGKAARGRGKDAGAEGENRTHKSPGDAEHK
jgi:predicted Fe-Mo cluster-binding NifX family protein